MLLLYYIFLSVVMVIAQNQQAAVIQQHPLEAFYKSIFQCTIYNDERDQVLKSWNLLQALWGVGKGEFNSSMYPSFDYFS